MTIPGENDPCWEKAIVGDKQYKFKFLGTKILLGRLRLNYKNESTPGQLLSCVNELKIFFEKNQNIPFAMEDLQQITGD